MAQGGKKTQAEIDKEQLSMIWGGGGDEKAERVKGGKKAQKRKREEVEDIAPEEEEKAPMTKKQKLKKVSAEGERQRTLHVHLGGGADRNDVRTLFEDYDPKVTVQKYANIKQQGKYALVVFKTSAMAEHAMEKFNGTDQKEILNDDNVQISRLRTRRDSKRAVEKKNKTKKAIAKAKWEKSKQSS
eukprot:TRINITY_DN10416_c1_g1_i1.p2 TRINITY_DN10416_c1_g1~~TRINITY_DN10416_c1_g1_i1.p2  ORF type:complete len:194 (+),score=79.52 TRINITY_DN10416_c1_g1_i1:25-582(+)